MAALAKSQTDLIHAHINEHGSITPLEALHLYGCFRLGARIWELKKRGVDIDTRMVTLENKKKVAQYFKPDPQLEITFGEPS